MPTLPKTMLQSDSGVPWWQGINEGSSFCSWLARAPKGEREQREKKGTLAM
jgi:hypothetical protein